MLVSEIKSKFKTYSDNFSFNFSNNQLNNIFAKAQNYYWDGLANKWGLDLQNAIDIAPISKRITITPSSNIIPYSSFPNYDRIGFVKPTYVIDGEEVSVPAKPIVENNKYSSLSSGTLRYPRYYLNDDGLVLEPSTTPTSLFCTYLREPYEIDFNSPTDDIPYTEMNVQGIIQVALNNIAVSQREYDQAGAIIQESQFNNNQ